MSSQWTRVVVGSSSLGLIPLLAACPMAQQAQRPLPERNKAACNEWVDHIVSLSCGDYPLIPVSDDERTVLCGMVSGEQEGNPFVDCDFTGYFECLIGQFSCSGDNLVVSGVELDDQDLGFAGLAIIFAPFEHCELVLDQPRCSLMSQPLPPPDPGLTPLPGP